MTNGSSSPWLSVLVPVYNAASYLERCVQAILADADEGVEVLLCDDCSTDNSVAVADALVARFPAQLRLLRHEKNRGPSAARNTMLDQARGTYFWFVDADDVLLPGAIPAIRSAIAQHRPDLIGGNYRKGRMPKIGFSGPSDRLLNDRDQILSGICLSRKMYAWLKISHRSLWQGGLRFPEGRIFEDATLVPLLALEARSFIHLRRQLLEYTVHQGSVLSGVIRSPDSFDLASNLDLAHCFDDFNAALSQLDEPMPRTRFAASHFIAMEFAKIVRRIRSARVEGGQWRDRPALAQSFRAITEAASPLAFEDLAGQYPPRGRMISWWKLRRALAFSRG